MNKLLAIAISFACTAIVGGWSSLAVGQGPVAPTTPDFVCDTTQDADRLTKRCVVKVKATWNAATSVCTVTEIPNVKLTNAKNALIVWDLPVDFNFCPALGDGVYLKEPGDVDDDSFDDLGMPDEGSGKAVYKKCKNRFRMLAENRQGAYPNKEYKYQIQFRYKKEKNACVYDPFIKNG